MWIDLNPVSKKPQSFHDPRGLPDATSLLHYPIDQDVLQPRRYQVFLTQVPPYANDTWCILISLQPLRT